MEENQEISFTEGPVFGSLIRFVVPVLGALILQAAYGAVDLMIVGRFGDASSISAVGTGSSFMQMVTFVITSLAMGSTVMIGQHIGEGKPEKAGDAVGTTIILFAALGIVATIVLELLAGNIVGVLQVPVESVDKAISYIRICSGGILIIIAYNVISGVLRGVGNAKLPFLFVGIACVVNIIGDLILVGVFHMDVAGAALATVLAQLVSVLMSVAVLKKQSLPVTFSLKQCRIFQVELKGILNIGAAKWDRARQGFFTAMMTGCLVGIGVFCLGFFGGGWMSSLFTGEAEVIVQSAAYLKGFSADCILTCILFSSIGYFNGCGRSIPVMIQGITSAFCIRIPVSVFMSRLPNTSLTLVGLATPITTIYGIIFFIICFLLLKPGRPKDQRSIS